MAGATYAATPAPKAAEPVRHATSTARDADPVVKRLLDARGAGSPLPPAVRLPLERSLGERLDLVRVHSGGAVSAVVEAAGARALTHGRDIYLGPGEQAGDLGLMGHEVAHVVQQRASPALQAYGGSGGLEREADAAAGAAASGRAFSVQGRTGGPTPQRKSIWARGLEWVEDVASGVLEFGESIGWKLAEQFVPQLVPILKKGPSGIIDWMQEKVTAGAKAVFDTLMTPVRVVSGLGSELSGQFAPMLKWAREAAGKIAQGDCTPLREAAEKVEQVAQRIIQPIVEKLQPVIAKVENFFREVWETIGAPAWEWIKTYFAEQWQQIKDIAEWIWDKAEPIRKVAARAWNWFKDKLGIGDGPEGRNGILQWVQGKLEAAGDWIKAKLAPYMTQIKAVAAVVGGLLLLISPAGPFILLGGAIYGVIEGVRWIKTHWGKGDALVKARTYLQKQLIPSMLGHVRRMTGGLVGAANALAGTVQAFAAKLNGAVGAVADSILSFAVSAIRWIADGVNSLAEWVGQKLLVLVDLVQAAMVGLVAFLDKVLTFLGKIANAVLDVWTIPVQLLGKVWNAIPACIRDPFVDFLIPLILRQIELFRAIGSDKVAWAKMKARIHTIIAKVFYNRDLMGAVKEGFRLVLDVFNVPEDMLVRIWAKAQSAWDIVVEKPLEFIKNTIRAIARGFGLLWANRKEHLEFGLVGWLTGTLAAKDIALPKSWTDPRQVFDFALSVMGLSMNHVFELLAKRFDDGAVKKLKVFYQRVASVVAWVREAIDTSKSPAENTKGIVDKAKGFAGDVITGIAEWIAGKVAGEVAVMAAAAAASAGLSEVVDIARRIYKAMLTAQRWMRQVMEMAERVLDSVLEVATGQIDAAGARFEKVMHQGMPVVIGFLADQVGLSGVGQTIHDLIDKLRDSVDEAILWLIDKGRAFFDVIVKTVQSGVQAVLQWWKIKVKVETKSGEKHTLEFNDDKSDPKLGIKSDWKDLATFAAQAEAAGSDPAKKPAIAAIRAALSRVDAQKAIAKQATAKLEANTGAADKTADQKKLDDAMTVIEAEMTGLIPHVVALLGTGPIGSEHNPIPIEYPKRRADAYVPISLGPRSEARIEQGWLRSRNLADIVAALTPAEAVAWQKDGQPIQQYFPWSPRPLPGGGKTIGLSAAHQLDVGMARRYKAGSTQGGGKINDALKPFGYRSRINGGEGWDGDHVIEMQIGGINELENLWPLNFSENRGSGSLLKGRIDAAKALIKPPQTTVTTDSFWVIIRTAKDV